MRCLCEFTLHSRLCFHRRHQVVAGAQESKRLYLQTHNITSALTTKRSRIQQDALSPPSPLAPPSDPCCGHHQHHPRLSGTAGNRRACAVKTHESALKEEVVWKWAWIQGSREATFSLDSDQWSLGRLTGPAQLCQEGTLTPIPELSPLLGEEHTPSYCSRNRVLGNRDREMAPTKDSWGQLSKVTKGTGEKIQAPRGQIKSGLLGSWNPGSTETELGRGNPGNCNRVGEITSIGELWATNAEAKEQHRCSGAPAFRGEVGSEEGLEMSRKGGEYAKYSERWQPSGRKSWEGRSPGKGFRKLDSHEFPLKGLLLRMWALGLPWQSSG